MERYGDLDELFPFCTVDGSELLNRLRCKKNTLKNHEKKTTNPNWLDSRRIFGCHQQFSCCLFGLVSFPGLMNSHF